MARLPPDVRPYQRTPTFTEETVPAGLTGRHSTKAGVWGVITVEAGRLFLFRLAGDVSDSELLVPGETGVVAPEELHRVEADGPVAFHVVFHRA